MAHTWWHVWDDIETRSDRGLAKEPNKPIGTGYVEAKRKFIQKIPVVGDYSKMVEKNRQFMQQQYQKREEEGGLGNWLLNRYADIPRVMGQTLASPITVPSKLLNVHPEVTGDLVTAAFLGRGTVKGIQAVAKNPKAMDVVNRNLPWSPASKKVVKVDAFDPSTRIEPMTSSSIRKYEALRKQAATRFDIERRAAIAEKGGIAEGTFAYKTEKLVTGGRLSRSGKPGLLPGTQDIASQGISKADTAQFNKVYGYIQKVRRQAPHHILDHSLTGQAYNRKDAPEVIDILATKHGIVGGNVRSNLMAATHDYTMKHLLNVRSEINRLRVEGGLKPLDRLDRQLIEATKAPERVNEKLWLSPRQMKTLDLAGPGVVKEALSTLKPNIKPGYNTRITSLLPKGVSIKDMRLDTTNMILGKDHMHVIHAAYEKSPERKALMKLIKSDKWLTLTPEEAADEIAKVYKIMENITINASAWRLKLIKTHLRRQGALGKMIADDPAKLKAWLIENPQIAANLNLTKKGPSWQELAYKPSDLSDEIRTVFEFDPAKSGVPKSTLSDFQAQWNAIYAPNKPWLTK